jgi:hypothetical protein
MTDIEKKIDYYSKEIITTVKSYMMQTMKYFWKKVFNEKKNWKDNSIFRLNLK